MRAGAGEVEGKAWTGAVRADTGEVEGGDVDRCRQRDTSEVERKTQTGGDTGGQGRDGA